LAKGPGWIYNYSSTNPVPGQECEVVAAHGFRTSGASEHLVWSQVRFYRVTSKPKPAPKPGWTATVHIEFERQGDVVAHIKWPNGKAEEVYRDNISDLDWQPPPPPPWKPEIGKPAWWVNEEVIVKGIDQDLAWVLDKGGDYYTVGVINLSPSKEV
jgi:hypothetical protein